MTTMFWVLWFFIAFVVVLVALTLRQESSDTPREKYFEQSSRLAKWALLNDFSFGFSLGSTLNLDSKTIGICQKVHTTTCSANALAR